MFPIAMLTFNLIEIHWFDYLSVSKLGASGLSDAEQIGACTRNNIKDLQSN